MCLSDSENCIQICDFGCSEFFEPASDRLSEKTKGTYLFMAPEMFKVNLDEEKVIRGRPSDIWAAGITLYNLLTKQFPFQGKNILELAENIKNQDPDLGAFSEENNPELIDLLKRMLQKDPNVRAGIYEIIRDPWVTDKGENQVDLDLIVDTEDSSFSSSSSSSDEATIDEEKQYARKYTENDLNEDSFKSESF